MIVVETDSVPLVVLLSNNADRVFVFRAVSVRVFWSDGLNVSTTVFVNDISSVVVYDTE